MKITSPFLRLAGAVLLGRPAFPSAVLAQPAPAVADQPWYPDGYRDLRIAAALQAETFPRELELMVIEDFDDPQAKTYDLIDCDPFYDVPEDLDERSADQAQLALDISKMRAEFQRLGYASDIYDQPLLEYERFMLAGVEPGWGRRLAALMAKYPDGVSEDFYSDGGTEEDAMLLGTGMLGALAAEMNSRRMRLSPRQPRFVVEGGCGAGEAEFTIRMVPANGELWLINAFAFRVCERKVDDPWNHNACRWSQYGAGDSTFASGRYMYEARWPNGAVQRGARVLEGSFEEDGDASVITFRRN